MSALNQVLINIIFTGGGYALLSLGFNLFYKTRKFIDVSYGSLIAIGGYSMLFFVKNLNLPFLLALVLALFLTAFVALVLEVGLYKKFRERKNTSLIALIASLGVYTVITATIAMIFGSQYKGIFDGTVQTFTIWNANISLTNVLMIVWAILGSTLVLIMLYKTRLGKAIRAIDDDREVAEINGVATEKIILRTVIIGALIAGTVGILVGYDVGLLPTIGLKYVLRIFIICVMGGIGSIEGGIASSLILSATENSTAYFLSSAWKDPIVFLVFLIVLLLRPKGIFYRPQK